MAAKKGTSARDRPELVYVPVVVALIAAVSAVIVALIGKDGDGPGPTSTTSTVSPTTGDLHVVSWGNLPIDPPPRVKFVFRGVGLRGREAVYVLGTYVPGGAKAAQPSVRVTAVSPPGTVRADGSWRVEWPFAAMPTAADFTAFSVAADSAGGLDGMLPPPPGVGSGPPGATVTASTVPDPTVVDGLVSTPGIAGPYVHDFEHITIAPAPMP